MSFSSRCICPGHTVGPFCHVTSRSFIENSWVWLDPIPPCLPIEVSFHFLTKFSEGILLYSAPLSSTKSSQIAHDAPKLLVIQLIKGRLQLILEGYSEPKRLEIKSRKPLNDGEWHTVYLSVNETVRLPTIQF